MDSAYSQVRRALEANGFKVVYEIDMLDNLTKFAKKNAVKDFNLNQLGAIKSMVFCNGPLAVKIGNADPAMLALCPRSEYRYAFTVKNRGGTYWYHTHAHHLTAKQAYSGLASFFIVEDDDEAALRESLDLQLGATDLPLVIADR